MKTFKGLLAFLILAPLIGVILPLASSPQPAEAQTGTETGTIDDLNSGWDTCAGQTIPHDNTGTEDLILQLTHAGTVVHTVTVAAGASDTLPSGDYIPTGASGDFVASLLSTYDADVIATKTLTGLDCQDADGDGFNADIDPDDNDSSCPGVEAGWSEIKNLNNGTGICGRQLRGYPSSIVYNTPLTECTAWQLDHPSKLRLSVWLLPIGTGSNAGNYIENTLAGNGIHNHTYGMMWSGSQIDHDGNIGEGVNNRWKPRGWGGHDVYSSNPIKVGFNPATGNFAWWDPDINNLKWREGKNGAYLGVVHTWASLQAAGVEPYLGFVAATSTTKTAPALTILTDQCLDTDGDTIYDYDENAGCEDDVDCDDDGVNDNLEQDPTCIEDADCDDDGLGDAADPDDNDTDVDDDGVLDGNEQDPSCVEDADCDDDNVNDGDEQETYCTLLPDCDDDGLGDAFDTDDTNPDRDDDGVQDGDEEDPSCITSADCDSDGLTDDLDPDDLDPDIDDDTILDGNEPDGCIDDTDCDDDGVADGAEDAPTCITDSDCDDDGLPDNNDPDDLNPDIDGDSVLDGDEQDTTCIDDSDCDDDGTLDPDDPDDLNPDIPEHPPEDTDGDGVIDDNEEDTTCINDTDCDNDGVGDLEDTNDLDPDQDNDGVIDGNEQEPICINDIDCDDDGVGDLDDTNDLDPDQDNDGVLDGDEPDGCITDPDCDNDGVGDGEEQAPLCITLSDCDNDGLLDISDPDDLNPDIDGDSVLDGDEQDTTCIDDSDCDDDGTLDADDEDDLDPTIPEITPEDTDGDGVIDDNEEDVTCITDPDCDDDNLGDLPDAEDQNPDQDDDGVLDGDEQEAICITDPDCDDDGILDGDDADDTEPFVEDVVPLVFTDEEEEDEYYAEGPGSTTEPTPETVRSGVTTDNAEKAPTPEELPEPAPKTTSQRLVDFLFVGWSSLVFYPAAASTAGAALFLTPWYLRFGKLIPLLGGSGPWWIILWKRRRWWCPSCDEHVKDEDEEACESCQYIFTEEDPAYRRYRSKKETTFRSYARLVWASREDKELLKRIATDESYVMSLLEDLDSE